jgi:PTH1 family peptidyl-tRNA hydrolase
MMFRRRSVDPPPDSNLYLIVGLGNPGSRYAGTRHNVGFMTVERLAQRHGLRFKGSKQRADIARGAMGETDVLLAMPVTYMNESGIAVSRLVQYYRVPMERLLVVCDDIDIPFGTLRLRPSGSSGGNNGLKSIARELGRQDFARLRLGVGRPAGSAISHVLGGFPADEARVLPALLDRAAEAIEQVVSEGVEAAMNVCNRDWLPSLSS